MVSQSLTNSSPETLHTHFRKKSIHLYLCHPRRLYFLIRGAFAYIAQNVIPLVRPTLHKDLAALCLTDNQS